MLKVLRPLVAALVFAVLAAIPSPAQTNKTFQMQATLSGRTTPTTQAAPAQETALKGPETDPAIADVDADEAVAEGAVVKDRSIAKYSGPAVPTNGRGKAKSNPEMALSFDALNAFQQRFANSGNQFTVEPPDQGLCAGNGFVIESVNSVLRVFDKAGNPLTGVIDLNTFYGYPAAINRTSGQFGPSITDPSCYFDKDTQRWFHVVLTLDRVGVSSSLSGKNHLDIAVSTTSSPLGSWNIYRIPVQNDGTQGTPNHGCALGACLGDYPQIGADANGFYITTNEFSFFGSGFYGSQIYAMSKRALVNGTASFPIVLINTGDPEIPFPGFTVWPARSADEHNLDNNGTEFFLSSLAVFFGSSNQLVQWSLSNTASLDSAAPSLVISGRYVNTQDYSVPSVSVRQKTGDFPFGQCLSDTTINTAFGPGCWRNFFVSGGPFANNQKRFDPNDSRMQQVYYANGKLWGALDTAVSVGGATQTGIAYFVINPNVGKVVQEGYVAVAGNNVTRPAVAVTSSGRGAIAFTLSGLDNFPTAGYVSLDAKIGAGDVHVAAAGIGTDDGFTGYRPTSSFGSRARWGDYGSAATDGTDIWTASEYINNTCTLSEYLASNFTCGDSRSSQANWSTRISKLVLK